MIYNLSAKQIFTFTLVNLLSLTAIARPGDYIPPKKINMEEKSIGIAISAAKDATKEYSETISSELIYQSNNILQEYTEAEIKNREDQSKSFEEKNAFQKLLNAQVLKIQLSKGVSLLKGTYTPLFKFERIIQPKFNGSQYVRQDIITLQDDFDIFKLFSDFFKKLLPVQPIADRKNEFELQWVRYFNSQIEAIRDDMLSVFPPIGAESLGRELAVGDFISFKKKMSWITGIDVVPVPTIVTAVEYNHIMITGTFQINIFKIDADTIRVKIFLVDSQGYDVGAHIGLHPVAEHFSAVVLSIIENRYIRKALAYEELLGGNKSHDFSKLFTHSYDLELKNSEAMTALSDTINNVKEYTLSADLLNPTQTPKKMAHKIYVHSLEPLENAVKYKIKNYSPKGVTANFSRSAEIKNDSYNETKNILSERDTTTVSFNEIYSHNFLPDPKPNYLFAVWSQFTNASEWFRIGNRIKILRSAEAIYNTDDNKNVNDFVDLAFNYHGQFTRLDTKVQNEVRQRLYYTLPTIIFNQIQWRGFDPIRTMYAVHLNYQYMIHQEGFISARDLILEKLNIQDDPEVISKSLTRIGYHIREGVDRSISEITSKSGATVVVTDEDRQQISERITQLLFDNNLNMRAKEFHSLKDINNFPDFGPGVLLSFLPQDEDKLRKIFYFSLNGQAQGLNNESFAIAEFGVNKNADFYDQVRCETAMLRDSSYDQNLSCEKSNKKK